MIKCFLLLILASGVKSKSYYSINAPGLMTSNRKYSVVATLHEADGPCTIRISITGTNFNQSKDVNLEPFQSKTIDFWPKTLKEGTGILKAEGLNGFKFENQSELFNRGEKEGSIYIQTDKSLYNPEELVRFRLIAIDEHTRPLNIRNPIHVEIIDANGNLVKHFKNISLTHGTFTGKFQLSKYPSMGLWRIFYKIDGDDSNRKVHLITVKNFILPTFGVYLKTPSNAVLADGNIKVAIYGKYTFNKYVEGNATIELSDNSTGLPLQTQHVDIQNIGYVDFNLKTIQDIDQHSSVAIRANLTEKNTGKTETGKISINLRNQRYNLIIPDDEIEFENNIPYSIKVYVKHWTGAPVFYRKTPVTMKHGNNTYESRLDRTGAATFEFDYDENSKYEFQYRDSKETFPAIFTHKDLMLNNREYYCRLQLVDKKIMFGKPVLIEVSSILKIPYLKYIIMGHGSLIQAEHIEVPPNQKSYTIEITPTIEMIPNSFIYVYYVHKGNFRYEEMILNFPDEFANQISLSAPKTAKPGEEVTITIHGEPQSYVGLLAVDSSMNLFDSSYDLKKSTILDELKADVSYSPQGPEAGIISGLITLTNAHTPKGAYPPSGPGTHGYIPPFVYREKFPTTWIFDNYFITNNETKLTLPIPDTVTTWRITAFSMNSVTGFGIVKRPTEILTIKNFFISLYLPYAVKRDEIVTIPVTIFNYSKRTQDTEVTLRNDDNEFYFMKSKRQDVVRSSDEQKQIKKIKIAAGKGKTVKFLIFPIKSGEINVKVTATSPEYSDAIWEKLKVEPEGVPKEQNQAMYISIPEGEQIISTFSIEDPVDNVPDSEYVTFSVGGHYLVPAVDNFEELTEMPTGSGEQNMINFAPSVLILQYLKVNEKLSKEKDLVESLQSAIENGYQQQLAYRYSNGGYSVFGSDTDEEPNTWLTAYVVRYFIKASQFLDIEEEIIESDLEYLANQQQPNGQFLFTGYLLNSKHENEYELTAFILLAFLENSKYAKKYEETITNGIEFLNSNINNVGDINAKSLAAAVIKSANLDSADILIDQIKSQSKENNGLRWWSANDQNPANDVELTANAALALLDTPGDHTGILKWLIEQRNANGGFISHYDTVAGMEALVKFSEKYTNLENVHLKLSYTAKDKLGNELATDEIYVDPDNVLSFQKHELPRGTRQVTYEMEGNGAALVQLNQQYNVDDVHEFRHFKIKPKLMMKNEDEYILNLCVTYLPNGGSTNDTTNMVISEVNLPSGFRSEAQNNLALMEKDLVKKVEAKNSNSLVILYLNKLMANIKYCLDIPLDKVNEVLMAKPAAIIIYDSYNISRSNTKFYNI